MHCLNEATTLKIPMTIHATCYIECHCLWLNTCFAIIRSIKSNCCWIVSLFALTNIKHHNSTIGYLNYTDCMLGMLKLFKRYIECSCLTICFTFIGSIKYNYCCLNFRFVFIEINHLTSIIGYLLYGVLVSKEGSRAHNPFQKIVNYFMYKKYPGLRSKNPRNHNVLNNIVCFVNHKLGYTRAHRATRGEVCTVIRPDTGEYARVHRIGVIVYTRPWVYSDVLSVWWWLSGISHVHSNIFVIVIFSKNPLRLLLNPQAELNFVCHYFIVTIDQSKNLTSYAKDCTLSVLHTGNWFLYLYCILVFLSIGNMLSIFYRDSIEPMHGSISLLQDGGILVSPLHMYYGGS